MARRVGAVYTREQWLDQLATSGIGGRLTPRKRDELTTAIGDAIGTLGGRFTMPYTAVAITATRAGRGSGRARPGGSLT